MMRAKHGKIGRASIKESFDNLPSGVCFANQAGIIVLCNRQMHRLCFTLMGKDLQHLFELRKALEKPHKAVSVVYTDPGGYLFPDRRVWQFTERIVTDEHGKAYTQVQAINVTELYGNKVELERENQALAEANARAKALYAELDQLVREREILAMKIRVHDELGLSLISSGKLLENEGFSLSDFHLAGAVWADIARNLGVAERSSLSEELPSPEHALAELLAAAEGVGVQVVIIGNMPRDCGVAYLLTVAMRECVTNIVYHAKGNVLTARLKETHSGWKAVLENNGESPAGTVVEGGGLGGLRQQIEYAGGVMWIESVPVFRLNLFFPRKEAESI